MSKRKVILREDINSLEDLESCIYVRKIDVASNRAIENLRSYCRQFELTNDRVTLTRLLDARRALLESAALIYIEEEQEKLFAATTAELELIEGFLIIEEEE